MVRPALLIALLHLPAAAQLLGEPSDAELASLVSIYEDFHRNPELSGKERRTASRVARELEAAGFAVAHPLGRGVAGVLKNGPGPTLLLRADMDALPVAEKTGLPYASRVPGVMHACGHDLHATALIGAARALAAAKDRWSGTLLLVGQPAEETGQGAHAMLEDGLYERLARPDFAFALHASPFHPAGTLGYRPGHALAGIDDLEIVVRGKGGHGAWPQHAKDPVVLAAQIVLALQTVVSRELPPQESAVLSVGSIHGGTKSNLIPDEVTLLATLRTYKEEVRRTMLAAVERIARGQAAAAGLPEELYPVVSAKERPTPSTYNDPALTLRLAKAFADGLGAEKVVETESFMGGEDFSRYGLERKIPISMFWLGAAEPGKPGAPLHSSAFAPAAAPALRTGVWALTAAALELLGKPR